MEISRLVTDGAGYGGFFLASWDLVFLGIEDFERHLRREGTGG